MGTHKPAVDVENAEVVVSEDVDRDKDEVVDDEAEVVGVVVVDVIVDDVIDEVEDEDVDKVSLEEGIDVVVVDAIVEDVVDDEVEDELEDEDIDKVSLEEVVLDVSEVLVELVEELVVEVVGQTIDTNLTIKSRLTWEASLKSARYRPTLRLLGITFNTDNVTPLSVATIDNKPVEETVVLGKMMPSAPGAMTRNELPETVLKGGKYKQLVPKQIFVVGSKVKVEDRVGLEVSVRKYMGVANTA